MSTFSQTSTTQSNSFTDQNRTLDSGSFNIDKFVSELNDGNVWIRSLGNRMDVLNDLPSGWDGGNALPVRFSTARYVSETLEELYFSGLPVPQLVPTRSGGLQVEWHKGENSVEVLVNSPNVAECYIFLDQSDLEEEYICRSDYSLLRDHLREYVNS